MNTRILPYLPTTKPLTGAVAAGRFDEAVFELHPDLVAFVRLVVEAEFDQSPAGLRLALDVPPMKPFRHIVKVSRADDGGLFPHRREVLQVRMIDGFDPSRPGTLRGGFLSNLDDRPPEPPKSPGELSHLLYAPHQTPRSSETQDAMGNLIQNDTICGDLASSIRSGELGLSAAPVFLIRCIEQEAWRDRIIEPTGERVRYDRFIDFVLDYQPNGLHTELRTLENVCRDDVEALRLLREVTTNPSHRPLKSGNNITSKERVTGTAKNYTLDRLHRQRPDLYQLSFVRRRTKSMRSATHCATRIVSASTRRPSAAVTDARRGRALYMCLHSGLQGLSEHVGRRGDNRVSVCQVRP